MPCTSLTSNRNMCRRWVYIEEGTIRRSREKVRYKSPFLACQLSMFFAPIRYRVVKIACSCSEMVLQTMKNYKAHYSLS
jgi:hypothetical protein